MAHKAIIIGKNKDKVIPDAYLEKVLAEFGPTSDAKYHLSIGVAFPSNGIVEHFEETPSTPTLDSVKEAMEAFPSDSVYYFARSDSEIQKEDLQPYSLIQNDEGKSILMAFLEGTFPSYENNDTHMPEHYVITDYVEGKLGEVWGQQEEDLTKVLKVIRTETFKREFTNLFIPRGMITLIAGTGEIFSYAKNDIAGSYPWGWTSNKLDYLEGGAVSNTVSKAGQTLAEKLRASAGKTTSVPITAPKTDTKIPDKVVPDEEITVPHFNNGSARKKWFNRNFQFKPEDWRTCSKVPAKLLKASSPLRMSLKSFKELPQDQIAAAQKEAAEVKADLPLMINKAEKDRLKEKFLTMLKDDRLISKEKIEQLDETYPTFDEATDYDLPDMLHWSVETIDEFRKQYPGSVTNLINTLRIELLKARPDLYKTPAKKDEEDKQAKRM